MLIPGFWLDGSSWDAVAPALREAGHRVHALTLPGMELSGRPTAPASACATTSMPSSRRSTPATGRAGRSGGSLRRRRVAHAAVDARPDRVARVVYVDCGAARNGDAINADLPSENGEVPLPAWSDVRRRRGPDRPRRRAARRFRDRAIPTPARVAGPIRSSCAIERRYDVPVTVIACEFPSANAANLDRAGAPWFVRELARIRDVTSSTCPPGTGRSSPGRPARGGDRREPPTA